MDGIFAAGRLWTEPRPTLLSNSPGGNYRALLYHRDADNHPTAQLVLEHQWHGIHLGQFTALESTPAATLHLDWTSPTTLHIACTGCDPTTTTLPDRDGNATGANFTSPTTFSGNRIEPVTERHGLNRCVPHVRSILSPGGGRHVCR